MLTVAGLSKTYLTTHGPLKAIESLDFSVRRGEFVCVVGPSGAGKSTLLRCMAGLMQPTEGSVVIGNRVVDDPPKEVAVVFQDYSRSLLPWLSVAGNVTLPLKNKLKSGEERSVAIRKALDAVKLSGFDHMYPWQLSGGMQQRVAIARALAYQPELLIMDEPFASVDAQTRADLEDLILQVRRDFNVTVVLVTHDIDESVYLGDRVIVLTHKPCRIQDIVDVDLPRPRDQSATKQLARFGLIRTRILEEIRGSAAARE